MILQWLTHPNLTPEHDFKGHIGAWAGSGWQVREDQSDPAPVIDEVPVPAGTEVTPEPPAETDAPSKKPRPTSKES